MKYFLVFLLFAFLGLGATEPLVVYLTWQRSPESTITIQWITSKQGEERQAAFRKMNELWSEYEEEIYHMPEGNPYYLHRLEIVGLEPDTLYEFKIDEEVHKFRTLPKKLTRPVVFVEGGDVYHDEIKHVRRMNKIAALQSPDFGIAGGDLAYTGAKYWFLSSNKFKRWMEWLSAWQQDMVTPDGRMIPLVTSIGNHDVRGRFGQTPDEAEVYYTLFPSPGYQALDFGDYMTIFFLDSGHTHPVAGEQAKWLEESLKERRLLPYKFAVYHVPAYPSVRSYSDEYITAVRRAWVPIFENYSLTAAFEHHDHAYKRTVPILNGREHPDGVVYLGDGAWGVAKPRQPANKHSRWYIEKSAKERHVHVVTLKPAKAEFIAVSDQGQIIDSFTR